MVESTKKCKQCGEVKEKEKDFYKAGTSYQSRCKPCHNKFRRNFKTNYVKKPCKYSNDVTIGKIKELRNNKTKWSVIAKTLNIPYQTLILIKNNKSIN